MRARFLHHEAGQSAVEYAIILAAISAAAQASIYAVGERLNSVFDAVGTGLGAS